jgi:hypothetical protein
MARVLSRLPGAPRERRTPMLGCQRIAPAKSAFRRLFFVLVLIDESGDAAFKIAQGSTPHFVLAMVVFDEFKEAEKAAKAIAELRHERGLKKEFKFSGCADPIKDAFFDCVVHFNFSVCAIVVQKAQIYSTHLRSDKGSFYNYLLGKLLGKCRINLSGAIVKLDGRGSQAYKKGLQAYLRKQLKEGTVKSIKFADSDRDDLVQLADMVAGAIARSYREGDRKAASKWRSRLSKAGRVKDIWDFQ